jgi:O-antigen/teichoic acid export membrane protein
MSSGRTTLKDKVVGGAFWNVVTQVTIQGTRVLVGIVLAHLLTPHDFGVAGMAFVFSNLLMLFTDLSLGAALIQRPEITEEDRSTIFWTSVAVGVGCTILGVALSGVVAAFFHQSAAGPLFAVLSLGFTLSALSATQTALVTRELAYRTLQLREIASILIGAAVAIVIAAVGGGPWAIVSQYLAWLGASVLLIWKLSPWRPQFVFSRRSLRELGRFGLTLFGSRLLAYANLNMDNLLVGRFLGSRALGIYSLAYNVMFTPMVRLGLPFAQVVFPAYARLQSDSQRLGTAWLRSKRLSAAVLAPVFLAMCVVAPDFVPVVLGKKWHAAVPVLQLLCLAGVAHSLVTLNWSVLQAQGKAGLLLRLNLFSTTVIVGAFVLGLQWGIIGVAACYAVAKALLVLPDNWVTARSVSFGMLASLRATGAGVPLAALSALVAFGFRAALVAEGVAPVARLVLVLALGLLVYLGLVAVAAPELVKEVKGLRGSFFRGRGVPSAAEGAA